jgi:hypothetical protein
MMDEVLKSFSNMNERDIIKSLYVKIDVNYIYIGGEMYYNIMVMQILLSIC